jgi:hypothetical protein
MLRDVVKQSGGTERTVEPEGPLKRSATLRQREAPEVGMQMSTPAARCPPRVGEQGSVDRGDPQQL